MGLLEQEASIRVVLSADRKSVHLVLTWQDIDVLESMQAALCPLADFTDMAGKELVTVSAIKPVLHILKIKVLSESTTDTQLTADIKHEYLERKYSDSDTDKMLSVSSFLDPRFKAEYIGSAATDLAVVKDRIAREGVELMPKDAAPEVPQIPRSQSSKATEPPAKKRKLSSWLKEAKGTGTSTSLTADQKVQKEIEDYLLAPALDSESNPLGWWKIHAGDFPIMAKVARKYLCICASSSASERVFSTSGQFV